MLSRAFNSVSGITEASVTEPSLIFTGIVAGSTLPASAPPNVTLTVTSPVTPFMSLSPFFMVSLLLRTFLRNLENSLKSASFPALLSDTTKSACGLSPSISKVLVPSGAT